MFLNTKLDVDFMNNHPNSCVGMDDQCNLCEGYEAYLIWTLFWYVYVSVTVRSSKIDTLEPKKESYKLTYIVNRNCEEFYVERSVHCGMFTQ